MAKYGNDDDEVDSIAKDIYQYISTRGKYWAKEYGFDAVFVSNVNPGAYLCGMATGATPNGRHDGDYCTIGNSPCNGQDRNGLIAMLNSVSKLDSANGGYITNLKVSKEMFTKHGETFRAVLDEFFVNGGQQLNITSVDKADMERALIEPEKYQNLIVRLGGWAVRFVELDRKTQQEVMRRTQY
jgi:pyruvate-formate lyase